MIDFKNQETLPPHKKVEILGIQGEKRLQDLVGLGVLQPLSAVQVKNHVDYVDPSIELNGLDFKTGKSTGLVIQVAMGQARKNPERIVYARPGTSFHLRAVLLTGEANIQDSDGVRYRYLDAKGTGNIDVIEKNGKGLVDERFSRFLKPTPSYPASAYSEKTWGQATRGWTDIDIKAYKKFQELGIKTVPIVATASIDEVLDKDGNIISIKEAKEQGYLNSQTDPYQIFRAWVTPFRLHEIEFDPEGEFHMGFDPTSKDIELKRSVLKSAMEDIGIGNVKDYLEWLAKEIGGGLGLMHKNGVGHGFLGGLHNITLDGRFMDLDSVVISKGTNLQIMQDKGGILDVDTRFYKGIYEGVPRLFDLDIDPRGLFEIMLNEYHKK